MSIELHGTDLRHWVIGELRKQSPSSVQMLITCAAQQGLSFAGRPSKAISDAIRWELRRGRIVKTGRGVYRLGAVPRTSGRLIDIRLQRIASAAVSDAREPKSAA
ncbi:MAG: hypothetical protein QM774_00685 [Gordonia sp. (in: high G+C Gram-positive bacteria)]|uniref:hypothetical protein n=1 Tax=Gordonia sp. (in: high G+C Gram-positive bacteria) TaxID=84139 RepID=UPI0039E24E63